ncbi:MAG: tail fiber domain-containing protein [Candidatus Margulisiibacteriota bacterium]
MNKKMNMIERFHQEVFGVLKRRWKFKKGGALPRFRGVVCLLAFALCTLAFTPSAVEGAFPQQINYQGKLTNAGNLPVSNATYSLVFTIYDASSGGTNLWTETQSVTTESGFFNVVLGSSTPIGTDVFNGNDRWLGIKVGSDSEMTPRQKLTSTGHTFHAYNADKLDGHDWSEVPTGGNYVLKAGDTMTGTLTNSATASFQAASGSVAVPSYSFSGDPDTGFYSPVANQIGITNGGAIAGSIIAAGPQFNSYWAYNNTMTLQSRVADGAGAIGFKFAPYTALTVAGAKIASFYNDSGITEKAYIDKDGTIVSSGSVRGVSLESTVATGTAPLTVASTTKVANLNADLLDDLDSSAFATTGSLSNYVAKAGDTMTGNLTMSASSVYLANGSAAMPSLTFAGDSNTGFRLYGSDQIGVSEGGSNVTTFGSGNIYAYGFVGYGSNTLNLYSDKADGATAIMAKINGSASYTTPGAKLLSIQNASTEKAYIDKDGTIVSSGLVRAVSLESTVATGTTPLTVASTTKVTNLNADLLDDHDTSYFASAGSLGDYVLKAGDTMTGTLTNSAASSFQAANGSVAVPSYSFSGDPDTGFYKVADNDLRLSVGGALVAEWTSAGHYTNQVSPVGAVSMSIKGAIANGATAIGNKFGNTNALTTSGAKIASFYSDNLSTEKAFIDKNGTIVSSGLVRGVTLESTVATGTAPLTVASTTVVTNLNADLLDDHDSAYFATAGSMSDYVLKAGDTMTGTLTMSATRINLANGTAASPSLSFANDIDSGIYLSSPGNWRMSANGAAILEMDASGVYVGASGILGSGNNITLVMKSFQADGATKTAVATDTYNTFVTPGAKLFSVRNAAAEKAYIDKDGTIVSSGLVRGVTLESTVATGTAPLTVASTTKVTNLNADLLDDHDSAYFATAGSMSDYVLKAGDTMTGTLTNSANVIVSGSVGIGTTSPGYKLDVNGTINLPLNTWFTAGGINLIKSSYYGYNTVYRITQLGAAGSNRGISLGADLTGNANDQFAGNEIIVPNNIAMIAPNAANNNYLGVLRVGSDNKVYLGGSNYQTLGTMVLDVANSKVGIGTTTPSEKLNVAGTILATGLVKGASLESTVATGTAPLTVASTTLVTNLNADKLDGHDWSEVPSGADYVLKAGDTMTGTLTNSATTGLRVSGNAFLSTSSGNVNIGTTTTFGKLTVAQASGSNGIALMNSSLGSYGWVFYPITNGSNTDMRLYEYGSSSGDRLTFQAGGNVGIGTTAPVAIDGGAGTKLHVDNGTSTGNIEVARFEGGSDADNTYGVVRIGHANDRGFFIKGGRQVGDVPMATMGLTDALGAMTDIMTLLGGNVGIGTTNPGGKLDIAGKATIEADGDITTSAQLKSTVATGTAPLTVASTTLVTNLNADQLDGHEWSEVPSMTDYVAKAGDTMTGTLTNSASASFQAAAGTAAIPSYSFSGDPNTGFYNAGANNIGVAANGAMIGYLSATTNYTDSYFYTPRFITPATTNYPMTLTGRINDGASAVGVILDNSTTLSTAGAKILSVRNNTTEKAAVGLNGEVMAGAGTISLPGISFLGDPNTGFYNTADQINVTAGGNLAGYFAAPGFYSPGFIATSGNPGTLRGQVADGGTAIATKFGNAAALTTAGAKIVSFYSDNLSTEKAYIDKDGTVVSSGLVKGVSLESTVATGTAPLTVASTTLVTNLNADKLDGHDWSEVPVMTDYVAKAGDTMTGTLTNSASAHISGNVGIGITAPNAPLNVIANDTTKKVQKWGYTSGNNDVYNLQLNEIVTAGDVTWSFDQVNNSTAYNNVLTIKQGNVGIGTTGPTAKLVIGSPINNAFPSTTIGVAGGNNRISFTSNDADPNWGGYIRNTYAAGTQMTLGTRNSGTDTDVLTLLGSNVGIGTTNPGGKLDIAGKATIEADGDITTSAQLKSTVATGTAPLTVASTTLVTNLNADQLDGHEWSEVPSMTDYVAKAGDTMTGTLTNSATASFQAAAGSAAVPSYSFSGDSNTGFYSSSDGVIKFTLNGTNGIQFSGQNVNANSFTAITATYATIKGQMADGATAVGTRIGSYTNLTTAGAKLASFFNNDATEKAYIDKDGTFSTGGLVRAVSLESTVATGTAPLTVASTTLVSNLNADKLDGHDWSEVPSMANYVLKAGDTMTGNLTVETSAHLATSSGRVGIGTASPTNKLEVDGVYAGAGLAAGVVSLTTGDLLATRSLRILRGISVGGGYAATDPPTNTIIVEGKIGIGTKTPGNDLDIAGKATIEADGDITTSAQFKSTLATGTSPLTVASTTKVDNLNADLLDGLDSTNLVSSSDLSGYVKLGPTSVQATDSAYAIWVQTNLNSPYAVGVNGLATGASGIGVAGQTYGTSGWGVFGYATAETGANYGGRFVSKSTSGYGVYGKNDAASGTNYGVYGTVSSAAGWAGYFTGGLGLYASAAQIGTTTNTVYKLAVDSGTSAITYDDIGIGGNGGWADGEEHTISGYHSNTNQPSKVGSIIFRYDTTNQGSISLGNLYNSGNQTNKLLTVIANGNVGIGTTSPQAKQHNQITSRATAFSASNGATWHDLIIQNPNNTQNAAVGIAFELNSSYNANAGAGIAAVAGAGSDYTADLAFITRPQSAVAAERMRITSGGNVGINTTSPIAELHVANGVTGAEPTYHGLVAIDSGQTDAAANGLEFKSSAAGSGYGYRLATVYDGGSNIDFRIQGRQGSASWSPLMTIKGSNGNVGIGNTNPAVGLHVGTGSSAHGLTGATDVLVSGSFEVNSGAFVTGALNNIYAYNNPAGGVSQGLYVDSTGVLGYKPSSRRYKHDIADYNFDVSRVEKLRPVKFRYNAGNNQDIGLIAEEVSELFPELVIYDKSGRPDSVGYEKVAVVLLKAYQEKQKEIDELKARLNALEAKISMVLEK